MTDCGTVCGVGGSGDAMSEGQESSLHTGLAASPLLPGHEQYSSGQAVAVDAVDAEGITMAEREEDSHEGEDRAGFRRGLGRGRNGGGGFIWHLGIRLRMDGHAAPASWQW